MRFAGRDMLVYCFSEGVEAVSAADGRPLWSSGDWKNSVIAPSPVVLPEGRLFFTAGYGAGSLLMQLTEEAGRIVPKVVFTKTEREFGCYQHLPIYHDGHIYAVLAAGRKSRQLACMDLQGNILWASGSRYRFNWGPYAMAEGRMVLLSDKGRLTLADVSADGFKPLAEADVLDSGGKAWGPMALAAGRLIVRSETQMVCLDLRAASARSAGNGGD
jgi:outer membrane protein assembly factor BamB